MPNTQPAEWLLAREIFPSRCCMDRSRLSDAARPKQRRARRSVVSNSNGERNRCTCVRCWRLSKPLPPDGRPTQGWVGTEYHPNGIEFASQALPEIQILRRLWL